MSASEALDAQFQLAVDFVQSLPADGPLQLSNDQKLQFYSLYKQATIGPNNTKKPGFLNLVAKMKWESWKRLGRLSKTNAKQRYLGEFRKIAKKMKNEQGDDILQQLDEIAAAHRESSTISAAGASGQAQTRLLSASTVSNVCDHNNKVVVYGNLLSQPTRAVLWFCKIAEIPHEYKNLDMAKQEHRGESFRKINPLMKVPAIEIVSHGDAKDVKGQWFESHTILRLLSQSFASDGTSRQFYPRGADEDSVTRRCKIDSYLDWHHLGLRKACSGLIFLALLAPARGIKVSPESVEKQKKEIDQCLKVLDEYWLAGSSFLVGESTTIADLSCFCEVYQLNVVGYGWSSFPNVSRYMERMSRIPGAKQVNVVVDKIAAKRRSRL